MCCRCSTVVEGRNHKLMPNLKHQASATRRGGWALLHASYRAGCTENAPHDASW